MTLLHEFRNKDHSKQIFVQLILVSEITNSEIRITSTLRHFCQVDRLPGFHFENPFLYDYHSCTKIVLVCGFQPLKDLQSLYLFYYCITTSFGTHALGPNSERGRKFTVMIEMGQYALIFERSIFHPINCCPE